MTLLCGRDRVKSDKKTLVRWNVREEMIRKVFESDGK